MWITNGGFADLFIVFAKWTAENSPPLSSKEFPGCKPGNEEHKMGIHGSSTSRCSWKWQSAEGKTCSTKWAAAHCRLQRAQCGALTLVRPARRCQLCAYDRLEIHEEAQGLRQADRRIWFEKESLPKWRANLRRRFHDLPHGRIIEAAMTPGFRQWRQDPER